MSDAYKSAEPLLEAGVIMAAKRPEDLFRPTKVEIEATYRELVRRWHPDRKDGDADVFRRVGELRAAAHKKLDDGLWGSLDRFVHEYTIKGRGPCRLHYSFSRSFELGTAYISDTQVTFVVDGRHRALVDTAVATTRGWRFASDRMKENSSRYLPGPFTVNETDDGRVVVSVEKGMGLLPLREVLLHFGGQLDARHVAWILSRLYDLVCYLSYSRVVHHDIAMDNLFIDPERHGVALLGGWWHAKVEGASLTTVPARTHKLLPWSVQKSKKASSRTDLELVRALGRELLGVGPTLSFPSYVPAAMAAWLKAPSGGKSVDDYRGWTKTLEASFGPRRFVAMDLTAETLTRG